MSMEETQVAPIKCRSPAKPPGHVVDSCQTRSFFEMRNKPAIRKRISFAQPIKYLPRKCYLGKIMLVYSDPFNRHCVDRVQIAARIINQIGALPR